jgi:hypothetical protein
MKSAAKTVRYTAAEHAEIADYARATGEQEAVIIERTSIRGLREERFEKAVLAYLDGASTSEAAGIASMDRHSFLNRMLSKGIVVSDDDPAILLQDLGGVAAYLGNAALADAVTRAGSRHGAGPD